MRIKITIALLICSISGMAQSGTVIPAPKTKPIKSVSAKSTPVISADTSETYGGLKFKDLQLLYGLLQDGLNGVASSPHYSQDQAQAYKSGMLHLDSLLKPQILKWHPVPVQPKK